MAAPDALGPIGRAADISVLDNENKELRKRITELDKDIEETKYDPHDNSFFPSTLV